ARFLPRQRINAQNQRHPAPPEHPPNPAIPAARLHIFPNPAHESNLPPAPAHPSGNAGRHTDSVSNSLGQQPPPSPPRPPNAPPFPAPLPPAKPADSRSTRPANPGSPANSPAIPDTSP